MGGFGTILYVDVENLEVSIEYDFVGDPMFTCQVSNCPGLTAGSRTDLCERGSQRTVMDSLCMRIVVSSRFDMAKSWR